MSYQVIARKWRPQKFEDVTGQEVLTRTLQNAIANDRLHHAYLFSGARGVGKTTTARLVARALNCHKSPGATPTPCAPIDDKACASCREIAEGRSMDVLEIDAASHTQVDNVREVIIAGINIRPARDRFKVFIIDEVHMLSSHSFNALLKTIEEPPPDVVFIMATTDEHKVPETITSRCQVFEFRTIATAKIADRLKLIAKAEKISIADEAIREIARAGDGSMRDAQSAFDQVISFAGEKIATEDVEKALGIAGADVLASVMNGIAENKPAEALAIVDDLVMRGHDLRNFCRDVLGHIRDLLVVKVSGDPKLLDSSSAQASALQEQASRFSESDLVRFFHLLAETEANLKDAANPRYQVEVALVKLMEMRRLASLGDLVARIAELESALRTGRAPAERKSPQSAPSGSTETRSRTTAASGSSRTASASQPATDYDRFSSPEADSSSNQSATPVASVEDGALNPGSFIGRLKSALEKRKKRLLIVSLDAAARVELEGDELSIEFSPAAKHSRDTLAKSENAKILREACADVCGREVGIRFSIRDVKDDGAALSPEEDQRRAKQRARQVAAENPTVQQVLKTFGGEIVDVKTT
ncbi:MAG TPA: DNA polymerase III subunit gamma/tau [Pyrinomonadaceae bacterium]|jgi:DNA polymerase-3 subunit gamma/tau|nr:DNA polymerase III subunit gamma/tau [Pyrinomonadaceae bacterium]